MGVGSPGLALSGGSTAAVDPSLMGHREFYSWFYGFVLGKGFKLALLSLPISVMGTQNVP